MGLPEDLREVLEVLRDGILQGHLALSQALKKRYEEQYPLVRSLADVFTAHVSLCSLRARTSYESAADALTFAVLRPARVQHVSRVALFRF